MNHEGSLQLAEFEFTKTQLKVLSSILPKGFSFELVPKSSVSQSSRPVKKVFTNEKKPVAKKNTKLTANTVYESNSTIKPALRSPNKRKVSTSVQYTQPELEVNTNALSIKNNAQTARKCLNILQKLKKHQAAGPFLYPVDVKGLGLYDYYDVVPEPMDISTVEQKLKKGYYEVTSQFAADVRKIWANSIAYNMEGSPIYLMTLEMRAYFEKLFRDIDNIQSADAVKDLEKKVEMLTKQIHELHQSGLVVNVPPVATATVKANKGTSKSKPSRNAKSMDKPLSMQERNMLAQNIKKLSPEHLRGVWDLVSQRLDPDGSNTEELEFDVEFLPVAVARELEKYVKNKLSLMNRRKNRAKAKEAKRMGEVKVNYSQQEGYLEVTSKGEDDITTQHHSVAGSDRENEGRAAKDDDLLSSGSSFISDSDSECEDNDRGLDYKEGKGRQMQQEQGRFLTVSGNFMLNSFIEN